MNPMSMGNDLIVDWQARHEALFGHHAIKLRHRLAESGLFTRQALAALIERCPLGMLLALAGLALGHAIRAEAVAEQESKAWR